MSGLHALLTERSLLVCCGPGGVGKTTTAAALALHAAELGRRALVLTIDPARRLATCLGLDELGGKPVLVERPGRPGALSAMMLDTRGTFDDLVDRLSPDAASARRIKSSRLYDIFAGSMHGTTEYMALESLYDVMTSGAYDFVALDTPPLTNALEFFQVPKRASWFFDPRVMRWFLPSGGGGGGLRMVLAPGAVVMRLLKHLAGASLVDDIAEFFSALELLSGALKERGDAVDALLRAQTTGYVVITSADQRRVAEALFLDEQLREVGRRADHFILNRAHDEFGGEAPPALSSAHHAVGTDATLAGPGVSEAIARAFAQLVRSGDRHRRSFESLERVVGPGRITTVPDLAQELYRMPQLVRLGERLGGAP